jgi:hypothetical protein
VEEIAREKGVDLDAVEIWFADEARIGQKNKIARRWARRGTRPSAPSDQRTASTYIFGAICPKDGKAVGLILPKCNTEAMQLHLDEIAKDVEPGRHAVLLLDKAGWHTSPKLDVPENLTLLPLPAKCPELTSRECLADRMFVADRATKSTIVARRMHRRPWPALSKGIIRAIR